MSLDHLREDLAKHLTTRPAQVCPVAQMTPSQYAKWTAELAVWAVKKETLQGLLNTAGFALAPVNVQPACTPRADYLWNEHPKRRSRAA